MLKNPNSAGGFPYFSVLQPNFHTIKDFITSDCPLVGNCEDCLEPRQVLHYWEKSSQSLLCTVGPVNAKFVLAITVEFILLLVVVVLLLKICGAGTARWPSG